MTGELETFTIEITTCQNLNLSVNRQNGGGLAKIFLYEPIKGKDDTDIGEFAELRPQEVICSLTGKHCVLYGNAGVGAINYSHLPNCPSAGKEVKVLYQITGRHEERKRDTIVHIERLVREA